MRFALPTLITTLMVATPLIAQESANQGTSPGTEIQALNCMVQYKNKVNVPAKAEGTLMELRFEEGDTINKDDVLGHHR